MKKGVLCPLRFTKLSLPGVFLVNLDPKADDRGLFVRSFCMKEFLDHNIEFTVKQTNISINKKKGILRGLHYQEDPMGEDKLIQVISGRIFDIVIDLLRDSPTYCKWISIELSDEGHSALLVPKGFAHGFQTLTDNTVILYHMSEFYEPSHARGIRWNDKQFGITWPDRYPFLSERDNSFSDFTP